MILLCADRHARVLSWLQAFFKVNGPDVQLPSNRTDITTAATIIQLAVPELTLVMDPLLYLRALPKPQGLPKLIHMTMANKHSLAPHQVGCFSHHVLAVLGVCRSGCVGWQWPCGGATLQLLGYDAGALKEGHQQLTRLTASVLHSRRPCRRLTHFCWLLSLNWCVCSGPVHHLLGLLQQGLCPAAV